MNHTRAWDKTAAAVGQGVRTSEVALPIMVWPTTEATRKIMPDGWKWEIKDGRGEMYEAKKIIVKILWDITLGKVLLIFVR